MWEGAFTVDGPYVRLGTEVWAWNASGTRVSDSGDEAAAAAAATASLVPRSLSCFVVLMVGVVG
jgi:hypothetical protein